MPEDLERLLAEVSQQLSRILREGRAPTNPAELVRLEERLRAHVESLGAMVERVEGTERGLEALRLDEGNLALRVAVLEKVSNDTAARRWGTVQLLAAAALGAFATILAQVLLRVLGVP